MPFCSDTFRAEGLRAAFLHAVDFQLIAQRLSIKKNIDS